jgi:antitoxin (DNA-binding transcriptional repressor) of toxin-antitoxin stability system
MQSEALSETLTIAEAKAKFSELVRRAEAGERFIITRHGKPVAEIAARGTPRRKLRGAMKGDIWIAPDFDELGPEWDEYIK